MKILLILRHAKSSWSDASLDDHDRPLNPRGRRDAPRIGKLLIQESLTPDLIVSSTAKRACKTAERVAEACGYEGETLLSGGLYHATSEKWIAALRQLDDARHRVLVVGHNPALEDLVETLSGSFENLPAAALAHLRLPIDRWSQLGPTTQGELLDVWRLRMLSDRES